MFGTAKQVFAKTISLDLVKIKPMNGPVGNLYYFDDDIENKKLLEERKKKIQKILDKKNEK